MSKFSSSRSLEVVARFEKFCGALVEDNGTRGGEVQLGEAFSEGFAVLHGTRRSAFQLERKQALQTAIFSTLVWRRSNQSVGPLGKHMTVSTEANRPARVLTKHSVAIALHHVALHTAVVHPQVFCIESH